MEGSHNDKDASPFVLIFCTLFILHNILIHFFHFIYKSIKLDKCHTRKGVLANHRHRMRPTGGGTGSGGRVTGRSTRPRLTRCDGRGHTVGSMRVASGLLPRDGRPLCKARSSRRRAQRGASGGKVEESIAVREGEGDGGADFECSEAGRAVDCRGRRLRVGGGSTFDSEPRECRHSSEEGLGNVLALGEERVAEPLQDEGRSG